MRATDHASAIDGGTVLAAAGRTQCTRCVRWETRGGTVLPAEYVCAVLADEPLAPAVLAVVTRAAFDLARRGRCPNFFPFPNHADAYRSQDLTRKRG